MNQSVVSKTAPWLGLLGAGILMAALFLTIDPQIPEPGHPLVVKVSHDQMKRSLAAVIAENPRLLDERERLIDEIKEGAVSQSLLVAEAFSQRLAENDYIVRNRLAEMQVMSLYERAEIGVTPDAVDKYFARFRDRYRSFPRRRILHLFVPITNIVDVKEARHQLDDLFHNKPSPETANWFTQEQLRKKWGPALARQIFSMPLSMWSDPIRSNLGWHRIMVLEDEPGRVYELNEVRTKVTEDLRRNLKKEVYEKEISRLKKKYRVEWTD